MTEETKIGTRATARSVPVEELGTALARVRCLRSGQLERMKQSLLAHGQLTPLVVVERQGVLEIVDGFKRRAAAAAMGWPTLLVGVRPLDETGQWVTMLALNRGPQSMTVLEEALVLREMVRGGTRSWRSRGWWAGTRVWFADGSAWSSGCTRSWWSGCGRGCSRRGRRGGCWCCPRATRSSGRRWCHKRGWGRRRRRCWWGCGRRRATRRCGGSC